MTKTFKISKLVSLPINNATIKDKSFIPKDIAFEDNKSVIEQVAVAVNHNIPVLLVGETGTGKTSIIRHLAAKTKNAFVRVNHNGGTTIEDIIGHYIITDKGTEWVNGLLTEAIINGYWYDADEINVAPAEILFAYNSLLDDDGYIVLTEKNGEVVRAHPNFRFFATMNPPAEYAGTKELNKALNSRFAVVKVDFVPPKIEAKIVMGRTGVPQEVADRMVKVAAEVRATHAKGSIRFVMSTRELIMWGTMFKVYGKYLASAQVSVLNKVSDDDKQAMTTLFSLHFKQSDGIKDVEQPAEDASEILQETLSNSPIGSIGKNINNLQAMNSLNALKKSLKNSGGLPNQWTMTTGNAIPSTKNPSTDFSHEDFARGVLIARDGSEYSRVSHTIDQAGFIVPTNIQWGGGPTSSGYSS